MPPERSTRSSRPSPATQAPTTPESGHRMDQDGGPVPATQGKKMTTTTENAKAIQAMQSDLSNMSGMLVVLTQRLCPEPMSPGLQGQQPVPEADPGNYLPRGRLLERYTDGHQTWSAPQPDSPHRDQHPSAPPRLSPRQHPDPRPQAGMFAQAGSRAICELDPLIAPPGFRPHRDFPTTLHGLEEDAHLQTRVSTLLSASLVPMAHATGKRHFAHSFIALGFKCSKTTLGNLSIPEYNSGFIRLINHCYTIMLP